MSKLRQRFRQKLNLKNTISEINSPHNLAAKGLVTQNTESRKLGERTPTFVPSRPDLVLLTTLEFEDCFCLYQLYFLSYFPVDRSSNYIHISLFFHKYSIKNKQQTHSDKLCHESVSKNIPHLPNWPTYRRFAVRLLQKLTIIIQVC